MYYLPNDKKCIENRALEIHLTDQIPLPMARSEAMAEWERIQKRPAAEVVAIGQGRLFPKATE